MTNSDVKAREALVQDLVLRDFIAGTAGGMLGILAGHPLDTAKTRLQAMSRFEGSTTWSVIGETMRKEGITALYRGMSFPLFSACLLNAIVFSVQGAVDRSLASVFGSDHVRLNGFLGGCVAGLVQSPIVTAADLAKCQRQVQFSAKGTSSVLGPIAIMQQRVTSLGVVQGCFQGAGATALKESPSYGLYFLAYEEAKRLMQSTAAPPAVATLLAGGLAGCVSLASVHPVDVVKSQLQTLPIEATGTQRSAVNIALAGVKRDGPSFLLRGFSAAMQRAFVINAATFTGYEFVLASLGPK